MAKLFLAGLLLFSITAKAYQLTSLKVGGTEKADILLELEGKPANVPVVKHNGDSLEMILEGAELGAGLSRGLQLDTPHPLIRRLSATSDKNSVKLLMRLTAAGSSSKGRAQLSRDPEGFRLVISPAVTSPVETRAALLKEEDEPLALAVVKEKAEPTYHAGQMIMIAVILSMVAAAGIFLLRFLQKKGQWRGSRKYLIEQLGYCPTGAKSGVSLLKVGTEFILVGVTPQQITVLSNLPKLSETYGEEAQLERGAFKQAVEEEYQKMKRTEYSV